MKKIISLLFTLIFTIMLYGQTSVEKKGFDSSKLTFGGGIGAYFGSSSSNISSWGLSLSPQVGYYFKPNFVAGAGVTYAYYSYNNNSNYKYSQNHAGINLFANYFPVQYIILSVRPEIFHVWESGSSYGQAYKVSEFVPVCILGAGVRYQHVSFTINYDILQNDNSPYGTGPFFSVGFWF